MFVCYVRQVFGKKEVVVVLEVVGLNKDESSQRS